MSRITRYGLCFAYVAAMATLILSIRKPDADITARSISAWDIAELAIYLNRMGIEVRMRAIPRHGPLGGSAYLTTTTKGWKDLNSLGKDPKRIEDWRGTLYCERIRNNDANYLIEQWGIHCLPVGPFLFYGDPELLEHVRNALASVPTTTSP